MLECELCKTLTNECLVNERSIIKIDNNHYELALWESIDEFGSKYKISITTRIKCCPECGNRFGDRTIEELDFTVGTYNCLKRAGINFLNELKKITYDDLIQIRNLSTSRIKEIQETLKRY